jgi:hypothetical protein
MKDCLMDFCFYIAFNGLLPKQKLLFAGSETFFDKSKACSRQFQSSPFGLRQLELHFFHFAKIFKQKKKFQ